MHFGPKLSKRYITSELQRRPASSISSVIGLSFHRVLPHYLVSKLCNREGKTSSFFGLSKSYFGKFAGEGLSRKKIKDRTSKRE